MCSRFLTCTRVCSARNLMSPRRGNTIHPVRPSLSLRLRPLESSLSPSAFFTPYFFRQSFFQTPSSLARALFLLVSAPFELARYYLPTQLIARTACISIVTLLFQLSSSTDTLFKTLSSSSTKIISQILVLTSFIKQY